MVADGLPSFMILLVSVSGKALGPAVIFSVMRWLLLSATIDVDDSFIRLSFEVYAYEKFEILVSEDASAFLSLR